MFDRLIRAFLVVGGVSVASAWTWPGAFPAADPVAVLVRYHTPNVYRAVVAWHYVAPGVAVFLAGQLLISTSRIWFARMGVRVGLRSRLPRWPLSPSADGPAIVVGEVHHPVRAIESPAPEWLPIPERGLYTGVAIFGAVGSGKTSACMHSFARQLLSWQADNPERRAAALVLEVKGVDDALRLSLHPDKIPVNAVLSRHETFVDGGVLCGDAGMHRGMAHSGSAASGTDGSPSAGVAGHDHQEGMTSQPEYTLPKPSTCPNDRDHFSHRTGRC